jgi:cytochrome-b5 reductase
VSAVHPYNHNTKILKFNIPNQPDIPVSSYVVTKAQLDGKDAFRPYTPIYQRPGELTLLVKSYKTGMGKHLTDLKAGDSIDVKGPLPKLEYKENMKKRIGMVAGGTGITPCLQVIKKILDNPNDKTQVTLLFANSKEEDILLKHELEFLQTRHQNFRVHHVISKPSASWRGLTGRIDQNMVRDYLPGPSNDSLIYVCGPQGMYEAISGPKAKDYTQGDVGGALKSLGFTASQIYKF